MNQLESIFQRLAAKAAELKAVARQKRHAKMGVKTSRYSKPIPSREVFISRLLGTAKIGTKDECWEWLGGLMPDGYGKFNMGPETLAHRASWYLFRGDAEGKYVLHKCDNPKCINPDHLFIGDQLLNIHDCMAKGRHRAPKGEDCPKAKLTEQDVLDIRLRHQTGESFLSIRDSYCVNASSIRKAAIGINWKHLPLPDGMDDPLGDF